MFVRSTLQFIEKMWITLEGTFTISLTSKSRISTTFSFRFFRQIKIHKNFLPVNQFQFLEKKTFSSILETVKHTPEQLIDSPIFIWEKEHKTKIKKLKKHAHDWSDVNNHSWVWTCERRKSIWQVPSVLRFLATHAQRSSTFDNPDQFSPPANSKRASSHCLRIYGRMKAIQHFIVQFAVLHVKLSRNLDHAKCSLSLCYDIPAFALQARGRVKTSMHRQGRAFIHS